MTTPLGIEEPHRLLPRVDAGEVTQGAGGGEFDVDGDAAVTLEEYTEPMSDFVERREDRKRRKGRHGLRRGLADPAGDAAAPSENTKPAE